MEGPLDQVAASPARTAAGAVTSTAGLACGPAVAARLPYAPSTSSDSRGQARAAQGPKSRSVRQAQAMPASGSTHRKLPERPGDFTPV